MSQNPFRTGGGGGGFVSGGKRDVLPSGSRGGGRGRGGRGGSRGGGGHGGGFRGNGRGGSRGRGGRGGSRGGSRGRGSWSDNSRGGWKNKNDDSDNKDRPVPNEDDWGKVKFKPVAKASTEDSTPWSNFKLEIIQKEREEQNANAINIDGADAKKFIKERDANFKKMLMTEKQKEPTQWEDFSDNETKIVNEKSSKKSKKNNGKQNTEKKAPLLTKEELKNFNSKNFDLQKSNLIRKVITKTTNLARGSTLEQAVKDLKHRGVKKRKRLN